MTQPVLQPALHRRIPFIRIVGHEKGAGHTDLYRVEAAAPSFAP